MTAGAFALALLLQAAHTEPVLAFPEAGLDDSSAYQGYQTRFYRESRRNTVQIYLEPKGSRAVLVWANAANESAGFTVRDRSGQPVRLTWDGTQAIVSDSGPARSIEFRLTAAAPEVELGWFVLGSMRIERDFVYAGRQLLPFGSPPFQVAEESLLVAAVARVPLKERRRHLELLGVKNSIELRSRLEPRIARARRDGIEVVRIERPSLDGRNRLAVELRVDPGAANLRPGGRTVSIRARSSGRVTFSVRVTTDAAALTPLSRDQIFNREFRDFLASAGRAADSAGQLRYRRLERQVRAVELLSSREKLMAGLPNFATYFGRDMMVTALMMRAIWTPEMSELVIASALGKLGPGGEVSHEEALGGQAIREHAVVYDSLVSEKAFDRAREVLRELQRTRENYHMIDDEFQLPVLVARYLADSAVPAARKRSFLLDSAGLGASRLERLAKELTLVGSLTDPYAARPRAVNLVSFPKRDATHWRSASWRDSDAGYAGGRFAMDVNAIWVPEALEGMATIYDALPRFGLPQAGAPGRDRLRQAIQTWRGARRHFEVTLSAREMKDRIDARFAWFSEDERRYWEKVMAAAKEPQGSLSFLALSLDAEGTPIPVVNTDPATGLFLWRDAPTRDIVPFLRPFPVGLFNEHLGPLVANDAYATSEVWRRFKEDAYHSPRVVWGREVNLLLLALANRVADGRDPYGGLAKALQWTLDAVHASGLEHNELWSYRIENGRLLPTRYGTSSDIQLWSTTKLAVEFALSKLGRR
jgi:hypothetical protein